MPWTLFRIFFSLFVLIEFWLAPKDTDHPDYLSKCCYFSDIRSSESEGTLNIFVLQLHYRSSFSQIPYIFENKSSLYSILIPVLIYAINHLLVITTGNSMHTLIDTHVHTHTHTHTNSYLWIFYKPAHSLWIPLIIPGVLST